MTGILVVNKDKDYTSRDVVNIVGKILGTKKIGHTGTLDPLARGVLVIPVGKCLKLSELLTSYDKEYIATVKLGLTTDTLDITGDVIARDNDVKVSRLELEDVLNSFKGHIKQEVPKYSAIKVNGRKLYEYARAGIEVKLPVRDVFIEEIELLDYDLVDTFTFRCRVSKGTYIRSLIRDIGASLGTGAVMTDLLRTKQGDFKIEDSYTLTDIEKGNYKLLKPEAILNIPVISVDSDMEFKIRNGQVLDSFFTCPMAFIVNNEGEVLALYKKTSDGKVRPYKMLLS